jgi:hypothetical protein
MRISVQTDHPVVALGLQDGAPAGVTVSAPPVQGQRDLSIPPILEIIVHVSKEVETALLAMWLYDKVRPGKGRTRLQINRVDVDCDEGEIHRIVAEQLRQESAG